MIMRLHIRCGFVWCLTTVRQYTFLVCLILLLGFSACGKESDKQLPDSGVSEEITLGAYYYPWYEGPGVHWEKDNLRQKLTLPQEPVLGEYDCRKEEVIKQHLDWASQAGINFFVMNWWGPATRTDINIKQYFASFLAREKSDFKFCISYATPHLLGMLNFEINLNQKAAAKMLSDFTYLAHTYFNHPNYLKINDRPVVFVYLSRCMIGDYAKALQRIRAIIKQQTKYEIYLVGDEIFWSDPNPDRIACFDAITVYNMYGPQYPRYAGFPEDTGFFNDLSDTFARYAMVARPAKVHFIPNVMPGFNDRGVRPEENHYVLPREIAFGKANEGSFYRAYFQVAQRHLDPELNLPDGKAGMAVITSWNGWQEDTQIEPVKPVVTPVSQPDNLTAGYDYYGYEKTYLTITREEKGTVSKEQRAKSKE